MYLPDNSGSKALAVGLVGAFTWAPVFACLVVALVGSAVPAWAEWAVGLPLWLALTLAPALFFRRQWRRQFEAQFPRYTDGRGGQSWL